MKVDVSDSIFNIPFLSKNFNNINIPIEENLKSCNNTCTKQTTKKKNTTLIYNYEDNLCDNTKDETSLYCADVQDESFASDINYSTFMMINGKCNDPKKCFFVSNAYLDKGENYTRLTEKDNPNKTLKNCCNTNTTDDFCSHNLMWGNSCNVALNLENNGATPDRVFLPYNTWAGGEGFQNPKACKSSCILKPGTPGCANGLDRRWCGPQINNGTIDWNIYNINNSPSTICRDLYGRHATDNSYILGDLDEETQRYFGNIICGPYIDKNETSFLNGAISVCNFQNEVDPKTLALHKPYGCPGSNESSTSNNLCVQTNTKTGAQIPTTTKNYLELLNSNQNFNIQYYPLKN